MPGNITIKSATGADIPALVSPDGQTIRRLGRRAPYGGRMFAARRLASNLVIPKSDRAALTFSRIHKEVPILDQGQVGECDGEAWVSGSMLTRVAAGQAFQRLSGSMLYALMNDGVDEGASISAGAAAMQKYGACLYSEIPEGFYTEDQIPASAYQTALRFRLDPGDVVAFSTWDEAVSLAIYGYKLVLSVVAGDGWMTQDPLDANGVPPLYRGQGDHAQAGGEEFVLSPKGQELLDIRNSWGAWGHLGGHYRITEGFIAYQSEFEGYGIRWAGQDPQDPNLAPIAS